MATDGHLLPLDSQSGSERPLGAALVARLGGGVLDGLATAFHVQAQSPWCPLVLATHVAVSEATLEDLRPEVCRITTIHLEPSRAAPTFDEVRGALAQRGAPTPTDMVGYIGLRTDGGLAQAVAASFEAPGSQSSALRRRLARLHMPSPQHWLNLFQLTAYLSAAAHPGGKTMEQVALECDRSPRTLSVWCTKYLRCTWAEARQRLGWEWAVEAALRGTVYAPPPRNGPRSSPRSLSSPEIVRAG
jgi:hypothetical protein